MPRRTPPDRFSDLVDAAARVFIRQGYHRTQMADVATALGVAKGTLYLYVESKEALFDAAVRYSDDPRPLAAPPALPLPTPPPGATLREVEKRVATEGALPRLTRALELRRVGSVRAELEGIVREHYATLAANRAGIRLVDRCAPEYPELADVWYRMGRERALSLLARYLEDRTRRRKLRRLARPAVVARMLLENASFWAVHRHWDAYPQEVDEDEAADAVAAFALAALLPEED